MKENDDKVNILLVDDQPQRLLSYEAILGTLGENLVKARSGTEALQKLMEADFAAILLDVNMPTMNGFDTAALIHQHPRFEKTPIIFVTAVHVTNLDQLKGYELGAVDYCYVPIVPEVLRGKVQVLVELYRKRRQLERANAALALANTTLQAEKTRELEQLNLTLAQANAELERANQALQREIAERKRFEQELQEGDRRKDEFLAMLSHELRNPLAAISNVAHVMKASPTVDPQLRWAREVLGRQTGHLTRLIDDLLDVSRITRGKVTLRREPLDLKSVVAGAIETTRTLVQGRRHSLQVQLPDEPVPVIGDRVRLTQVVDNILTNAAKYTKEDGSITISLVSEESAPGTPGEAVIRVRDSGVGIPPELLPTVFDLFRRADESLGRAEGGLGIGLALARGLVEMHGGRIEAASDGPGKGSEFTIRLPRSAAEVAEPQRQASERPRHGPEQLRVLVVDDSVDSAESMAIILEMSGHDVRRAHNGPDALKAACDYRPDVVLMDIGMPGMSGHEVAQKMREAPATRDIVLIAMTGYGRQVDREQSQAAGFDHHLVKPLDFEKLNEVLAASAATGKRPAPFVPPAGGKQTSLGVR
jgi:signal transduction histidine kinase